ncbi:MAG TPA: hypothetical protein PLL69_03680 [Gemmatimonadales bacterium]|nr:hypothetical protein [Gemmatimonadales bacterium]
MPHLALRNGRYVIRVAAPTDDRKQAASRILGDNGAGELHFFGPFTIEPL